MNAAVTELGARDYDLSEAKAKIGTALAAGRAQVRLRHAEATTEL